MYLISFSNSFSFTHSFLTLWRYFYSFHLSNYIKTSTFTIIYNYYKRCNYFLIILYRVPYKYSGREPIMYFDIYEKLKLYKQLYPEKSESVTKEELENTIKLITKGGSLWEQYFSQASSVASSPSV